MGYMDETEKRDKYDFLESEQGEKLFARLDFSLKNGVHIQDNSEQQELFLYVRRFQSTLVSYYRRIWGFELEEGQDNNGRKYYFPNFNPELRNKIPWTHKHALAKEYIIVAFLLYKVYYNDAHIELNSISKFQYIIRVEYPDLKPHLIYLLAKAKSVKSTQYNEDIIDNCLESALIEFDKLKWIILQKDGRFEIQPSFHRFTREFAPYINQVDELFKINQDERLPPNP